MLGNQHCRTITSLVCVSLLIGATTLAEEGPLRSGNIVLGDLGKKVDEYLSRLVPFGYSGAAIVAKDGQVILSKGYGLADREKNVPVTPETVFTVGSITKQFTGAAIMRLEMEGKLNVTDSISKYLDGVPLDKQSITIHHLLTHTAGLPDGFGGDHDLSATRQRTFERAMKTPLRWTAGSRHDYSNLGYSLLAMIVEKVSGMEYERYLHDYLLVPSGMKRTGYMLPKFKSEDFAVGYISNERWGTVLERPMLEDGPCWNLKGNGGIHSTIGDMYRWHVALEGDQLLSPEAKEKYFAPHADEGRGRSFYGYGWVNMKTSRGTTLITHNGGNGIFSADFRRYIDEGVAFFHASNSPEFFVDPISDQISRILFGEKYTLAPESKSVDASTLSGFAGSYASPQGDVIEVQLLDNKLMVTPHSQQTIAMVAPQWRGSLHAYDHINKKSLEMINKSAKGDHALTCKAFESNLPCDEVTAIVHQDWKEATRQHGTFKKATIVGSLGGRRGEVSTMVRREFQNGSDYVRYIWDGNELVGLRTMNAPFSFLYAPATDQSLVTYDLLAQQTKTLMFEGAPKNKKTSIKIATGRGERVFKRLD